MRGKRADTLRTPIGRSTRRCPANAHLGSVASSSWVSSERPALVGITLTVLDAGSQLLESVVLDRELPRRVPRSTFTGGSLPSANARIYSIAVGQNGWVAADDG